ncbi:MAG: hypothetical protein AB4060_07385 [Crocosphaera sp.]
MNPLNNKKTTLFLTVIGLVILSSSTQPTLSHSGHNHDRTQPKSTKIEEEKIQSSPTTETENTQEIEKKTINVTLQESNQFKFIPQASEIVFLLMVSSPIILKTIKQKI